MPDPLSVISATAKTVEKLWKVSQKVKDVETRELIADLRLRMADLKVQFANLQEENLRLREESKHATTDVDIRGKLTRKDNVYFLLEPVMGYGEGPYCPTCFDVAGKLITVSVTPKTFEKFGKYFCANCKEYY